MFCSPDALLPLAQTSLAQCRSNCRGEQQSQGTVVLNSSCLRQRLAHTSGSSVGEVNPPEPLLEAHSERGCYELTCQGSKQSISSGSLAFPSH